MDAIPKGWRIALHLLAIPATIALFAWSSFITSVIWNWFAVPILRAPSLSTVGAMGLGCVVACFTWAIVRRGDLRRALKEPKDALERLGDSLMEYFMIPTCLLGLAWIIKGFL